MEDPNEGIQDISQFFLNKEEILLLPFVNFSPYIISFSYCNFTFIPHPVSASNEDSCTLQSVAKSWDCLVDDPDFAKLHLDHSLTTNTNLKLFLDNCLEHDDKAYSVDFDSLNNLVQFPRPLTAETKNIWFLQWFTCRLSP